MATADFIPQFPSGMSPDEWPRISIVTPSYNKATYLEDTIQSILGQAYPNLEYLIVDGNSTDESVDIIRRYESELTWWTSESDDGMYDALQKGFARTTGDIMKWVNADDILHPGALFTVGELFHVFPDVEWIQGCPSWVDEAGRFVCSARHLRRWSKFDYYLGDYRWIQQESTFWRRSLWEKSGGYIDPSLQLAGDLDLWARFFRYAPLHVTEAVLGAFRWCREGQLSLTRMDEYVEEASQTLQRERDRLTREERRTLQRLQWMETILDELSKFRILNVDGIRRRIRSTLVDLPPVLRFRIEDQSFVKRAFFPKVQI
jgi:glycosyltransferase involved in cell wall biosynthesis